MSADDPSRERGVALLMLLIGLVAVGSLAVGGLSGRARPEGAAGHPVGPVSGGAHEVALRTRRRALRAREAMLAHATVYADLYGATGAGPGHLSCPDRDAPPGTAAAARIASGVGPDPPCGRRPRVAGALPVHVTVGRVRSVLDGQAHAGTALAYELDAAVVNNPIDRPVNARLAGNALARIDGSVTIDARHLVPPVTRRVAGWVAERLNQARDAAKTESGRSLSECVETACSPLPWLLGSGALEDVPLPRHWFVRNGWTADIRLRVEPDCVSRPDGLPVGECAWRSGATASDVSLRPTMRGAP